MISSLSTSIDTSRLAWASNKVWFQCNADTAWQTANRYYVLVELYMSGAATPNFSMPTTPNTSGQIYVELHGAIKALMSKDIFEKDNNLPTFDQNTPRTTDQPYNFTVLFKEYTNGELTSSLSRSFRAIDAGLDYDDFTYQEQKDWLYTNRKFFSSQADDKPTSIDVPEYLYFFNTYITVTNVDVRVRLYYTDGTDEDYTAYSNIATNSKTLVIPVSYEKLQISANADNTKIMYKYRVWLTKAGDTNYRISEPFSFELIENPCIEKRVFLFYNSLGGYETFFTNAALLESIESKKSVGSRLYGKNYRVRDGQFFVTERQGTRQKTAATAWLPVSFAESLQDAAISPQVWEIRDGKYIPVIVDSLKAVYYEKDNQLRGYVFEYRDAYDVDLYTKNILRPADGLPVPPAEPTYIESYSLYARGTMYPVLELNKKITAFDLKYLAGQVSNFSFKYSEGATPSWGTLPLLNQNELIDLIVNGAGVYKIQFVPNYLAGYTDIAFRFEFEEVGIAANTQNLVYTFNGNAIDTVVYFPKKIDIVSYDISPIIAQNTSWKVRTTTAVDWNDITGNTLPTALASLSALPVDTEFELMTVVRRNDDVSRGFTYTYTYQ
jgi:hypothetical protein